MIDILSTLHSLLSHCSNTPSQDLLEMFCAVSPIAAYSNEIVPPVPKQNVSHIGETVYSVTLNADGPPIRGYILSRGDEYIAIECVGKCSNTGDVTYIPVGTVVDVSVYDKDLSFEAGEGQG